MATTFRSAQSSTAQPPVVGDPGAAGDLVCHYMSTAERGRNFQHVTVDGMDHYLDVGWHEDPMWLLQDGEWTPLGRLVLDIQGYLIGDGQGMSWGSFTVDTGAEPEYRGTWCWDWGHEENGHGIGHAVDASDDVLVLTFLIRDPQDVPPPPERPTKPIPGMPEGPSYLRMARG